jgi:hypothetical protein
VQATLALLGDSDDEVREAGRAVVGAVAAEAAQQYGMEKLQQAFGAILAECATAARPLLPSATLGPSRGEMETAGNALVPQGVHALLYIDDSRAMVLIHALALLAIESACLSADEMRVRAAGGVAEVLVACVRRLLVAGMQQLNRLQQHADAPPAEASEDISLPFSVRMLHRTLFTEQEENEGCEDVLQPSLAVSLYTNLQAASDGAEQAGQAQAAQALALVCGRMDGTAQLGSPTASSRPLLQVANAVVQQASGLDLNLSPMLLSQGPWVPHAGPDDCPFGSLWAAARVAEKLLLA